MLDLIEISKSWGSKAVLKSLSLSVPTGEVHVLLGASGSGKSTLLKTILGTLSPDSGHITMDGGPRGNLREWAARIGFVPQGGGLFPHLTAADNISLMANLHHWSKKKIQIRMEELRKLVSLETTHLLRYPRELSGGQAQRVALMRALFLDPQAMLLDEPLGALDPLIRSELQSELRQIFKALGKTVIIVTHDLGEAAYLGDRISLISGGKILQSGKLKELLHNPADPFVSFFLNAQRTLEEALK